MFTSGTMAALTAAKAFGGQLQKLGNRLNVPVCVVDIDMPEICGKFRQFLPHIETSTVALNEPSRRKAVSLIPEVADHGHYAVFQRVLAGRCCMRFWRTCDAL
jgi:hypothetical protein